MVGVEAARYKEAVLSPKNKVDLESLFNSLILGGIFATIGRQISLHIGTSQGTEEPQKMSATQEESGDQWASLAKSQLFNTQTKSHTWAPISAMVTALNDRSPFNKDTVFLDIGCGSGSVTADLAQNYTTQLQSPARIIAGDFSTAMVDQVTARRDREVANDPTSLWSRVETGQMDAQKMTSIEDDTFTHAAGNFVFFLLPDRHAALRAHHRVLAPGGLLAVTSFKSAEWIDAINAAVAAVEPSRKLPMTFEAMASAQAVEADLAAAGFKDARCWEVPMTIGYESHEKYARFCVEALPNMVEATKGMSGEQVEKVVHVMTDELKRMHPEAPGVLHGVALAGMGRK